MHLLWTPHNLASVYVCALRAQIPTAGAGCRPRVRCGYLGAKVSSQLLLSGWMYIRGLSECICFVLLIPLPPCVPLESRYPQGALVRTRVLRCCVFKRRSNCEKIPWKCLCTEHVRTVSGRARLVRNTLISVERTGVAQGVGLHAPNMSTIAREDEVLDGPASGGRRWEKKSIM